MASKQSPEAEPGDEEQQITFRGESLTAKTQRLCKKVATNITIEPIMFLSSFVTSMDGISVGQLLIDKSCAGDFNFTSAVCDDLLNEANAEENTAVQNEVAQYKVWVNLVDHLFPILCSFFLGSWSDHFGRKLLLYIYFGMKLLEGGFLFLNAYFMDWPKEYMLFTVHLPVALSGGYLSLIMGINAFIADISAPDQRSFRLATVHYISSIGYPFGTQLGAYLFHSGGYLCVIGAAVIGRLITLLALVGRLEMYRWRPSRQPADKSQSAASPTALKRHHALSPRHVLDSLRTACKPRENGKRLYIWLYFIVIITIVLPMFGESSIGYNYVRSLYHWQVQEYSNYSTVTEIIAIVIQGICIPLFGYLQIRDAVIIPFLVFGIVARDVLKAFAKESWMYYVATVISTMGGYSFSASRSIISQCVESHEIGKIFALLSSLESLVPLGMSQAYASLWRVTSGLAYPWVGSVFLVSAGVTGIGWLTSIGAAVRLRGSTIADLSNHEVFKPTYRATNIELSTTNRTADNVASADEVDMHHTNQQDKTSSVQ